MRAKLTALTALAALCLTGCGAAQSDPVSQYTTSNSQPAPTPSSLQGQEVPADLDTALHQLSVTTCNGRSQTLTITDGPIAFVALWIPHAETAIDAIASVPGTRIVFTWLRSGDEQKIKDLLKRLSIDDTNRVFMVTQTPAGLNRVPELLEDHGYGTVDVSWVGRNHS